MHSSTSRSEELINRFLLYCEIIVFKRNINHEVFYAAAKNFLQELGTAYQRHEIDDRCLKEMEIKLSENIETDTLLKLKQIFFNTFKQSHDQPLPDSAYHPTALILKNHDSTLPPNSLLPMLLSISHSLSKLPYQLLALPWTISSFLYDSFIDGKHSWKEVKYYLAFHALLNAFDEAGESLEDVKEKLFSIDEPRTDLENETLRLIDLLLSVRLNPTHQVRVKYQQFITKLREILRSDFYKQELEKHLKQGIHSPCIDILLKICKYRFMEVHIFTFCEHLITMMIQKGFDELYQKQEDLYSTYLSTHPLDLPLEIQFKAIHAAPQMYKAPHLDLLLNLIQCIFGSHDPQKGGNIPYVLYDFQLQQQKGESKSIRVIRTGTPTNQRFGTVEVNPEFQAFVAGQKVLFIRLEDEQQRYIGDESIRNKAFKAFREEHPENFFLAILGHDTDFFHQRHAFDDPNPTTPLYKNAAEFKTVFLKEMLDDEKIGYFFPSEWKQDPNFTERLSILWDEVHEDFFQRKEELFQIDRANFIMALHMRLPLELAKKTDADVFVFCCKDSIDRANILNSLLLLFILILLEKDESIEHARILKVFIHAATVIVKKREMNARKERLLSFLQLLMSPEVKARLRKRKEEIGLMGDDIQIRKKMDQVMDFM